MTEKFPWKHMMQMGLGTLHLSPQEFWRSTPREIAGAFSCPPQHEKTNVLRQSLDEMMSEFPDT